MTRLIILLMVSTLVTLLVNASTSPTYNVSTLVRMLNSSNSRGLAFNPTSSIVYITTQYLIMSMPFSSVGVHLYPTVLAGGGAGVLGNWTGFSDGQGTAALFNYPTAMAIQALGNIYITDFFNQRIRVCTPSGIVTTLAGSGLVGSVDGAAIAASFSGPYGIVIDSANVNLFVTCLTANTIRQVVVATGWVSTVAGAGVSPFLQPSQLAWSLDGNLLVGDSGSNRVLQVTVPAGVVTTFAGTGINGYADGAAVAAMFANPSGLATDSVGNVFVADSNNNRVRRVDWLTRNVTTEAGNGVASSLDGVGVAATLNGPLYLAMVNGSILVAHAAGVRLIALSCPKSAGFLCRSQCEVSTYTPGSVFSNGVCVACMIGTSFNARSATCVPCAAGSFASSTGLPQCSPCAMNSFANVTGSSICSVCAHGTSTMNVTGATSCTVNPTAKLASSRYTSSSATTVLAKYSDLPIGSWTGTLRYNKTSIYTDPVRIFVNITNFGSGVVHASYISSYMCDSNQGCSYAKYPCPIIYNQPRVNSLIFVTGTVTPESVFLFETTIPVSNFSGSFSGAAGSHSFFSDGTNFYGGLQTGWSHIFFGSTFPNDSTSRTAETYVFRTYKSAGSSTTIMYNPLSVNMDNTSINGLALGTDGCADLETNYYGRDTLKRSSSAVSTQSRIQIRLSLSDMSFQSVDMSNSPSFNWAETLSGSIQVATCPPGTYQKNYVCYTCPPDFYSTGTGSPFCAPCVYGSRLLNDREVLLCQSRCLCLDTWLVMAIIGPLILFSVSATIRHGLWRPSGGDFDSGVDIIMSCVDIYSDLLFFLTSRFVGPSGLIAAAFFLIFSSFVTACQIVNFNFSISFFLVSTEWTNWVESKIESLELKSLELFIIFLIVKSIQMVVFAIIRVFELICLLVFKLGLLIVIMLLIMTRVMFLEPIFQSVMPSEFGGISSVPFWLIPIAKYTKYIDNNAVSSESAHLKSKALCEMNDWLLETLPQFFLQMYTIFTLAPVQGITTVGLFSIIVSGYMILRTGYPMIISRFDVSKVYEARSHFFQNVFTFFQNLFATKPSSHPATELVKV